MKKPELARRCGWKPRFLGSHSSRSRTASASFVDSIAVVGGRRHAKRPFGGPEYVIQYLARYTHRVAISDGRLIEMRQGQVTFRWRDSADGNKQKLMTLDAIEFIRRYLMHVLPSGFVKIRHFGSMANRNRRETLLLCRSLLPAPATQEPILLTDRQRRAVERKCPFCKSGTLHIVGRIPAGESISVTSVPGEDTS